MEDETFEMKRGTETATVAGCDEGYFLAAGWERVVLAETAVEAPVPAAEVAAPEA